MSANYASGLSEYEHKGVCGLPEVADAPTEVSEKVELLSQWIKESKHVVVHCGAGLSTSAGIPDFRGPNGIWTLEKKGLKKEDTSIPFESAQPTYSHRALASLINKGLVHYIISQNIDGLFHKTGIPRKHISELHGNFYLDECNLCSTRFVRNSPSPTMGLKVSTNPCLRPKRPCRGFLRDTILDWEDELPVAEIMSAESNALKTDLAIVLGSSMQINPAGRLPFFKSKKSPARKVVIINLQKTKYDSKASLVIHDYIDNVFNSLCEQLDIKVPVYDSSNDLTNFSGPQKVWKK